MRVLWTLELGHPVLSTLLQSERSSPFCDFATFFELRSIIDACCLIRVKFVGQQGRCVVAKDHAEAEALVMEYSGSSLRGGDVYCWSAKLQGLVISAFSIRLTSKI